MKINKECEVISVQNTLLGKKKTMNIFRTKYDYGLMFIYSRFSVTSFSVLSLENRNEYVYIIGLLSLTPYDHSIFPYLLLRDRISVERICHRSHIP